MRKLNKMRTVSNPVNKKRQRLTELADEFRRYMGLANYQEARRCCEQVLSISPGNPTVLGDYALTLMRTGEHQHAYQIYTEMFKKRNMIRYPGNWMDGLAEVCGWLGKDDELQKYGHMCLASADEKYKQGIRFAYPAKKPANFNAMERSENIIAFSLYGASPKYCETLIKNVEICSDIYPAWTCRVYYDSSVPVHVLARLEESRAQMIDMSEETLIPPTMWRFLVIDDPSVSRFLVRDADSLFSEKESAAVSEWTGSGYWFHHMRDYFTHTELLLAGLWGGCRGVFSGIRELMADFVLHHQGASRFTDQHFLREKLWPTIRDSILNHDEIFHFHGAVKYPQHPAIRWKTEYFHIGSNASLSTIGGAVQNDKIGTINIEFLHEETEFIYPAHVAHQRWMLAVPFFLIQQYQEGTLTIKPV